MLKLTCSQDYTLSFTCFIATMYHHIHSVGLSRCKRLKRCLCLIGGLGGNNGVISADANRVAVVMAIRGRGGRGQPCDFD